jgi:hypothetical protein
VSILFGFIAAKGHWLSAWAHTSRQTLAAAYLPRLMI